MMLLALSGAAFGQAHGNVGLGIQLGEPSGITGKFWLGSQSAVDATVGWNLITDRIVLQAGYLHHFPLSVRTGSLAAYVGIGGLMGSWDYEPFGQEIYLAARVPLGLEFIYEPVSFYAEVDPLVALIPATDFDIGGGIGFRFYF